MLTKFLRRFFAIKLDKPQDVVYNTSGSPDIPLLSYLLGIETIIFTIKQLTVNGYYLTF